MVLKNRFIIKHIKEIVSDRKCRGVIMKLLTEERRKEKKMIKKIKKGEYYKVKEYLSLLKKKGGEVSYINKFISALIKQKEYSGENWNDCWLKVATVLFHIDYEKFYKQIDALLSRELYSVRHFLRSSWKEIAVNPMFSGKYLPKLEATSFRDGEVIQFMKQYKDYICCEDVFKKLITWIENHEGCYMYEFTDYYFGQEAHHEKMDIGRALVVLKKEKVVDNQTFETAIYETGSAKTILSYLKMSPKAVINWLEAEDRLCELKDVDSLLKFLELYEKSNRYRIGNIILKYGTVSQTFDFVLNYPDVLILEEVAKKIKQFGELDDLILFLKVTKPDFEGRKELEEHVFEKSNVEQLLKYLTGRHVLNRACGEDCLLERKSQNEIVEYFGDYHDLVKQEQKFLEYLTTIHDRNTLQDAFWFLKNESDSKKVLSYLEAFLRVRNIEGVLTILGERKGEKTVGEYLLKQGCLDLEEVKELLLITSNQEHQSLLESAKEEYQGPVKNLAEKVDQMALAGECVIEDDLMSPEEQLWLVNLSLTRENVLPSAVRNTEEVKENLELYLELLKKCDERKYMYYRDAFSGNLAFEVADHTYQYYLENQRKPKKYS